MGSRDPKVNNPSLQIRGEFTSILPCTGYSPKSMGTCCVCIGVVILKVYTYCF